MGIGKAVPYNLRSDHPSGAAVTAPIPGDLVIHKYSDRYGVGLVLEIKFEEYVLASVKWFGDGLAPWARELMDIRADLLEIISEKL